MNYLIRKKRRGDKKKRKKDLISTPPNAKLRVFTLTTYKFFVRVQADPNSLVYVKSDW